MRPIEFPQQTHILAKDQPQYTPLLVHIDESSQATSMTFCCELNDDEVTELIATRKLWLMQSTFGNRFQPIRLSTQNPFTNQTVEHGS